METVKTQEALVKTSAPLEMDIPDQWVARMQIKLHRWAGNEPGYRFDDLFNLVYDPRFLAMAWDRIVENRGARSAGSDGLTVAWIAEHIGPVVYLNDLRGQLKTGTYRPEPVRERKIPKPGGSGKVRRLGIPTVADRVVQAALKLVLEPIFEADFEPVSYGFRPNRRAHDAVAEIHHFGTQGYRWVLDADIEACFDRIDHTALLGRVRARVKDKRVVALVRAFLKAGLLTELGDYEDTYTGTPQGGILSPLLANIALSVLDEALHAPWQAGASMSTSMRRKRRRWKALPNWRLVRYADDFVVLTDGTDSDLMALREEITLILAPMGLVLSSEKTSIGHMREGFDFLGFHIKWAPKKGTSKWHVYTFVGKRPLRSVKAKIRALTPKTSQADLKDTLIRINQITRGWANYFRHAVASRAFDHLQQYTWSRIVRWQRTRHRWKWKDVRRWLTNWQGRWLPIAADGVELFNPSRLPIRRYRYRGYSIPTPFESSSPMV